MSVQAPKESQDVQQCPREDKLLLRVSVLKLATAAGVGDRIDVVKESSSDFGTKVLAGANKCHKLLVKSLVANIAATLTARAAVLFDFVVSLLE